MGRARPPGRAGQQQGRAAGVLFAQQPDGLGRRRRIGDGDRVRGGAERRGHRDLVSGGDGEQFGGRTEQARETVAGGEQRAGAVLAAQAEGERVMAGREGGAFAFGRGGGLARRRQRGLRGRQGGAGAVVPLAQFMVLGVQAVHLGLELFVLLLGGDRALARLVTGRGEAADLRLGRRRPAARRVDLAVQPGEALAAVGDRAGGVLESAFLGGQLPFQLGAVRDGVVAGVLGRLQRGLQLRLLLPDPRGLALHVLRVAAATLVRGGRGRALHPRVGQRDRAPYPFGQLGQLVPGLLGPLEARRQPPYLVLQLGFPGQRGLQPALGVLLALLQFRLVRDLRTERVAQPDQIVGEQPQPRVAQIGLYDGGPPGDRGLPSEGFELTAQLVGEVLDSGQVRLHRVQLPQRLLLALAVFEYAGGLLDERPAPHRVGVQYGVELALADDDMHLAADTAVGQQFLDIEKAAGIAIELVFAAAVAEHDPRNGDFRVVDGQRTVGVVDGQRDLGAAERRAPGRPGEDHVFHLAAAQ